MSKKDFNKTHPELEDGEVFWGNVIDGPRDLRRPYEVVQAEVHFRELPFKAKRMGQTAYMTDGTPIRSPMRAFPVFVQESEIKGQEGG
jgi:hypothetical protein